MALIAQGCFNKSSWIKCHCNHCLTIKVVSSNMLLLGEFIIAGLAQYQVVRKNYFVLLNTMSSGIQGDCVERVLWQAISLLLPWSIENLKVNCRTNSISTDSPCDIADCIINLGTIFWRKS